MSYRINEPLKFKEANFNLRYIRSLQDESSQFQSEFDKFLADSYMIFSNISLSDGQHNSEFRLINDWQVLLGIKLSL